MKKTGIALTVILLAVMVINVFDVAVNRGTGCALDIATYGIIYMFLLVSTVLVAAQRKFMSEEGIDEI